MSGRIHTIVAGGQSGVEIAALDFAVEAGVDYRGVASPFDEPDQMISRFPRLVLHARNWAINYYEANAKLADALIWITDEPRETHAEEGPRLSGRIRRIISCGGREDNPRPFLWLRYSEYEGPGDLFRFLRQFDHEIAVYITGEDLDHDIYEPARGIVQDLSLFLADRPSPRPPSVHREGLRVRR